MDAGIILTPSTGDVKTGVITPPSSESGVITPLRVNFSSKSTAMDCVAPSCGEAAVTS